MKPNKGETDRLIAAAVRKNPELNFHVNTGNEHCVELIGRERKGSLWITPRKRNDRLQTTGQAQRLDSYIEGLCGPASGSQKEQVYQFWYLTDPATVEKVIDRFARLP